MEDLAEAAIAAGDTLPRLDKLDLASIERLTEAAIEHENLPALMSLAKINKYAVSNTLNTERLISLGRVAGSGGVYTPRLYFVMRGILDIKRRKILKRLTRTSILKLSLRIASEGLRGDIPVRGEYQPEGDFDLDIADDPDTTDVDETYVGDPDTVDAVAGVTISIDGLLIAWLEAIEQAEAE